MTCGVIVQIICTVEGFAGYLVAKSLRVVIQEAMLVVVFLQKYNFVKFLII